MVYRQITQYYLNILKNTSWMSTCLSIKLLRCEYGRQGMARSSTSLGAAGSANGSAAILVRRINPRGPATGGQRAVSLVALLDETCAGLLSTVSYSGSLTRLSSDDCAVTSDDAAAIGLIVGEAVANAI